MHEELKYLHGYINSYIKILQSSREKTYNYRMVYTCEAEDWYGIDTFCEPQEVIQCPHCTTTIHYDHECWYCDLHATLKLEWIDPIPKKCKCGVKFKR